MRPAELNNISMSDSWVLSVESTDRAVIFTLDAVLERGHPRFYWPPKPGEQHAYARIAWRIEGDIHWNEGPHLDRPAMDAKGERDYGHIDAWIGSAEGGRETLEGDWGCVVIDGAQHTVAYLDGPDRNSDSA